mmetsp:Transcript_10652/g.25721  ORF Transcript_10652/g.25721 Transcript_10652/m.25721 type:complete len:350 (-) Transcript_10652:33-1082(-)
MTSTTSGESLKDRLKDARSNPVKVASLGQLFDIAQGDNSARTANADSDSDDDSIGTNSASGQQVKWVELVLDNTGNVVIKKLNEDDSSIIETTTIPAGSAMMNTLSDDMSHSFRSINEKIKSKNSSKRSTKRSKAPPSLGETIGRDRRAVQHPSADERTRGTVESEQTAKAANHDPRESDTVHVTGFEDLKTGDTSSDSDDSDDDNKSARSLPTRRRMKNNNSGDLNNMTSSSGHEPRRLMRRRSSRQVRTRSNDAGPRNRSRSRRATRRGSTRHPTDNNNNNTASEIDEFMAMTKDPAADAKESTDGTMSTATESTMATDTTSRSRRNSLGPLNTMNPTLIQNFQLTF